MTQIAEPGARDRVIGAAAASQADVAAPEANKARQRPEQCCLARAVGSDDGYPFAGRQRQRYSANNIALTQPYHQIVCGNGGRRRL